MGATRSGVYLSTDIINNPVLLLEYIKLNQNWEDNGEISLIKTGSGIGSFDHDSLNAIKGLLIARQITNKAKQTTSAICKEMCEAFYLLSRQDQNGYECLYYLLRDDAPEASISLSDVVVGSVGNVIGPKTEDIVVTPEINYGYDYASEKFRKSLKILNTDTESTWSETLTPGFSGNDGELIWNTCRQRYLKYGIVNTTPSVISNQYWIADYDTALWKIKKAIEWVGFSRFSMAVPYSTGRLWYPGMQVYVTMPHETDGEQIKGILSSVSKNKNNNTVKIKVILIEDIPYAFSSVLYQMADGVSVELQDADVAQTDWQEV